MLQVLSPDNDDCVWTTTAGVKFYQTVLWSFKQMKLEDHGLSRVCGFHERAQECFGSEEEQV